MNYLGVIVYRMTGVCINVCLRRRRAAVASLGGCNIGVIEPRRGAAALLRRRNKWRGFVNCAHIAVGRLTSHYSRDAVDRMRVTVDQTVVVGGGGGGIAMDT